MRRIERVLAWLALAAAIGILVVSLIELDRRASEEDVAQPPTALPSPVVSVAPSPAAGAASPGVTTSPAETQPLPAATTSQPAGTTQPAATVAPPRTPTPAPILPTPTPRVGASGVEPMPKTGGGAVGGGLAVTVIGLLLARLSRRAY